tara:strand:- start:6703 stop:7389 length:687 start_codon:yes stop_codon:yes gene_type:complete
MINYRQIFDVWRKLLVENESFDIERNPTSLRVLDFDHTVAFTGELVYIISPEDDVIETLDSEEYSHHTFSRDEIIAGYRYDFREFDDVDPSLATENQYVTEILKNFINAGDAQDRIILILTARNQEAEPGIRNYLETIGIDHSNIRIVGVGSSSPQKKVDEMARILDQYESIDRVSFFDDSSKNTDEMVKFFESYDEETGREINFDVAKVEQDGRLIRLPGYRTRKKR